MKSVFFRKTILIATLCLNVTLQFHSDNLPKRFFDLSTYKIWQTAGKQKLGSLHTSLICASERINVGSRYFH